MNRWFCVLLLACNGGAYAVQAGDVRLSTEDAKKKLASANPATREFAKTHMKEYLVDQIANKVLAAEATRLGVKPSVTQAKVEPEALLAAALKDKMAADLRTTINAKDLTDEEIMPLYQNNPSYPYYPPRVMVIATIFKKKVEAEQFAREAKSVKNSDDFRRVFQKALERKAQAETWDFDITRAQTRWPTTLVEPAFAAKIGDILGPIAGTSSRYAEERFYVLRIEHNFPESNSFAQVKERLREMAMDAKVVRETEAAARQRVMAVAKFDDVALSALMQGL